jgi:hypothetical protein
VGHGGLWSTRPIQQQQQQHTDRVLRTLQVQFSVCPGAHVGVLDGESSLPSRKDAKRNIQKSVQAAKRASPFETPAQQTEATRCRYRKRRLHGTTARPHQMMSPVQSHQRDQLHTARRRPYQTIDAITVG